MVNKRTLTESRLPCACSRDRKDTMPKCPECGSVKTTKAGFNIRKRQDVQRHRCKDCKRVFTEKATKVE